MIYIKENDRRPVAAVTINKAGTAVDLTLAASVMFKMVLDGGDGSLKVESAAVITDAENGKVEYRWASGDTDEPGLYLAEWEVTWDDDTTETYPTLGFDYVVIEGELG